MVIVAAFIAALIAGVVLGMTIQFERLNHKVDGLESHACPLEGGQNYLAVEIEDGELQLVCVDRS